MCKVRCPACRKGICEIIATAEGRAVIVLKCPPLREDSQAGMASTDLIENQIMFTQNERAAK